MKLSCIWEHNGNDTLLYVRELPGAYARGRNLEIAAGKLPSEVRCWCKWAGLAMEDYEGFDVSWEQPSQLNIRDADSDMIFPEEGEPLTTDEYEIWKELVLRSAGDFQRLYDQLPDQNATDLPERKTFYGVIPRTGREMYLHTKNVNEYYFWEIGVDVDNEGSILECRSRGFAELEKIPGFLAMGAREGSYGEMWSLRKLLRRFLWHDRIHAKAMYRMAVRLWGPEEIEDVFHFQD